MCEENLKHEHEHEEECGHEHHHEHEHEHDHEDCGHEHHHHEYDHDHEDCGHEHHHEHEHDHEDCGHEHHHEYEHDHEDCGHEHHHHEHDHGHEDCGHDHEHDHHHHHHEAEPFPSVSVYTHDLAVIGSVKCRIEGSYEEALDELQGCMEATAKEVEANGGLIGHVKAFAKEEARNCMISITDGEDTQRKPGTGNGIYVESANIVFGIEPEQLENILETAFAKYLH